MTKTNVILDDDEWDQVLESLGNTIEDYQLGRQGFKDFIKIRKSILKKVYPTILSEQPDEYNQYDEYLQLWIILITIQL